MGGNSLTSIKSSGVADSIWVLGDFYTFTALGKNTGGGYELIDAVIYPGGGPPPHRHSRESEAFYILSGQIQFTIAERTIDAKAGDFVHSPPGIVHCFKNVTDQPAKMLILVMPANLEKFFRSIGSVASGESAPSPITQSDINKVLSEAPKYGIEILPPPA